MKKTVLALTVVLCLMGKERAAAEGPASGRLFISQPTFDLISRLAKEKTVVSDVEDQNHSLKDGREALEIQAQWAQGDDHSDPVKVHRDKASCLAMRKAFSKEISLVDCFTLDAQGRVVGSLYKPQDFLQEKNPHFVNCYNHGAGEVCFNKPKSMGKMETVEISVPVMDGTQTVGVLVATVLPEKY